MPTSNRFKESVKFGGIMKIVLVLIMASLLCACNGMSDLGIENNCSIESNGMSGSVSKDLGFGGCYVATDSSMEPRLYCSNPGY